MLAIAAVSARSVALAGFALDSLIEISASVVVMCALAAGKVQTGRALGNPVLRTEGQVTMIDGLARSVYQAPTEQTPGIAV